MLARRLSAFTRVWRLERWIEKVQMCANLIDLKARYIMLQNEYLLAKACQKVDFDTTESEPSNVVFFYFLINVEVQNYTSKLI